MPHKDAGERARQYVVCCNPKEQERQRAHRKELLEHLDAELESLGKRPEDHPKRACELLASKRYGKYLRQDNSGRLHIDRTRVSQEEQRAHVTLCVLSLLLERVAEIACGDTWRNIRAALRHIKAGEFETPHGSYVRTNRIRPEAAAMLNALSLPAPGALLSAR